jgi:hypothetical protein
LFPAAFVLSSDHSFCGIKVFAHNVVMLDSTVALKNRFEMMEHWLPFFASFKNETASLLQCHPHKHHHHCLMATF